jgi:hypothetical protein
VLLSPWGKHGRITVDFAHSARGAGATSRSNIAGTTERAKRRKIDHYQALQRLET